MSVTLAFLSVSGVFAVSIPLWRASKKLKVPSDDYVTAATAVLLYSIAVLILFSLTAYLGDNTFAYATYGNIIAIFSWPLIVARVYKISMQQAGELTWDAALSPTCFIVCLAYSALVFVATAGM
jgi:hypothetical protein